MNTNIKYAGEMTCITLMPRFITSVSDVNILNIYPPKVSTSVLNSTAAHISIKRHCMVPFFTLSYFPAPKFCPTKVVAAIPNAVFIIQYMLSIFPNADHAATVSTPKLLSADCTIMLDRLYMLDCIPVGSPIFSMDGSTSP